LPEISIVTADNIEQELALTSTCDNAIEAMQ
jgi:hypothetical protein